MPVVTLNKSNVITLDTMIAQSNPTLTYGTNATLQVGVATANQPIRILLKFDFGLIPNNAVINSATLNLHQSSGIGASRQINAHLVTSVWDNNATWNTPPTFDSALYGTGMSPASTGAASFTVDVKAIVQSIVNGTANNGLLLKDSDETTSPTNKLIDSFDATSNQPSLTIDYTIPSTGKKQVEYVGSGAVTATASATIATVSLPVHQTGDLLLAHVIISSVDTITPTAGWTKVALPVENSASTMKSALFYKYATSNSESAPTFTIPAAANWHAIVQLFRNVKSIKGFTSQLASGTSVTPPSLETSITNTMFLLMDALDTNATYTPPLSFDEKRDQTQNSRSMFLATRYLHQATGLTGSGMVFTTSVSSSHLTSVVALEPIVNNPPTISDTDHDLGTFTAPLLRTYNVNDVDPGATVTLVEKLNGTVKRTIPNATLGADYTLDLTTDWLTLDYGNHTATIEATDDAGAVTVRTWTFGKRLATTDDLILATKGVQDVKPFLDAIKLKLVGKVGGSTADTFDNIIATMSVKKVKSGTFTISGAPVAVTGLGFTPRILFIKLNDSYFYFGFSDYNGNFYGLKNAAVSNTTDLVRNADGFTVPVNATNYPNGAWQYYAGE